MEETLSIEKIVWDPKIYPRGRWDTSTIERYADALDAGDIFPPVILEQETNRLLDGKHRLEAHKKAGKTEILVEWRKTPEDMSTKYFAATLSAKHGDRLSNTAIKELAEEDFSFNPNLDPTAWGKGLGVSKSTVYRWVSHIINKNISDRQAKAWRLSKLGWTQEEIGVRLGVTQSVISEYIGNSHLGKINKDLGPDWNEKSIAELANRTALPLTDTWAAALDGMDDVSRLDRLEIKIQPYDVWNFKGCHDLMGDKHPGRIPGELVCHVLYFFTKPGSLILDPMAGSGTVLDACLLMGRKARGYDIDERHNRIDIENHNLSTGWPDKAKKADLIFWDPPYFDKKDKDYVDGSISGLSPEDYLAWFSERFKQLFDAGKKGLNLIFLMSDWDPENAKNHADHPGIYQWDYVNELKKMGWNMRRSIQIPLSTQQIHPDIVLKFRQSRRLARLSRYLLVITK